MKPKAKPVRKRAQKAEAKAPAASVIEHIKDLKPDQKNARKHNPRNIGMIEKALQEVGAARSIVIDEDNNILAGNGTIEAAAQAGITKLQIVDADGETIIAVRRTGLTKKQKTRLAIFDNKTTDESEWDYDVLADIDRDYLKGIMDEVITDPGDPEVVNTEPYKRIHVLLSFNLSKAHLAQDIIDRYADEAEIEVGQN